jgi:hypothetical protein
LGFGLLPGHLPVFGLFFLIQFLLALTIADVAAGSGETGAASMPVGVSINPVLAVVAPLPDPEARGLRQSGFAGGPLLAPPPAVFAVHLFSAPGPAPTCFGAARLGLHQYYGRAPPVSFLCRT